jgi:glycosyltransferase involved in cell wall biosynthesis
VLTSVHPAFDVRIFHKQARTLVEAGFDVHYVVPHDAATVRDGVHIVPVAQVSSRLKRMIFTPLRVLRTAHRLRPDICHLPDPELIPIGLALKLLGYKVVYDAHEDLPDQILSKGWIPTPLRGVVSRLTRAPLWIASHFFDAIVAATPQIASRFPGSGAPLVVANYPRRDDFRLEGSEPYETRPNQIVFAGGVSDVGGVFEMVEAVGLLPPDSNAELVIVGRIDDALALELSAMPGWSRVRAVGLVDRTEVGGFLHGARIGIVVYHPVPNYVASQPNKLYEYMVAGLPVVASDFPLWRDIVVGGDCGLVVDPMSPPAIAEAIQYLLTHAEEAEAMGRRGREVVQVKYNWEVEGEKLVELYESLALERPPSS